GIRNNAGLTPTKSGRINNNSEIPKLSRVVVRVRGERREPDRGFDAGSLLSLLGLGALL
ncbi:unnamed protein product, partial [Ectocarpus sp. 8 AP-2014]